ncbi:adenylate/guanylate cyclase domain-containing protein [Streptomyces profundus]|uniref:adenylate/guanylate cyclase domain-containing protein n=1 Tax=Streptomyces profundus TaxID=2867410 RepID=UPI001D15EAC3|nr:adenylate/guanylate cyclase domain-containing protein [Streptomyces sp. MA3_2.13]UED85102.1 AAA family ATPase [Streptomyces sp. MA3_2.13]
MFCAPCRRELPSDARFCHLCGQPCAPTAATGRATGRKVVTVLFCDLVGSTALSGTLDAETLRSVSLRWFDRMRLRIEEHGGTVEKFIGDAVMAVFGVPTVREDDARQAIAAALGMRAALTELNDRLETAIGVRLEMRIGINTGQAVTGSSTARQAMVSGEIVNVAARLEQNASAGEILIGADTLRAAGAGVRVADIGPLRVKGKSERVTAHRLLGLDAEEGPDAPRGTDVDFVGRAPELAALDAALRQVIDTRRATRMVVSGEAGQGKTRLLREWLRGTTASAGRRWYGVGRGRARGEQASLGPLADAVSSLLRTEDTVPPSLEHPLEHPLGLALLQQGLLRNGTPHPSVDATCAALVQVLTDLTATRPAILVIDDCHWAADPFFDVLDQTLAELTEAAVLVVLLTRPQLFDRRPELAGEAMALAGLRDEEARLLAAGLAAHDGRAPGQPLAGQLLERAGGNPLHLEQLLIAQGALGAAPGDVPLPLQALIGARIDTLDPPERRALGLASVLGRDFTADELLDLADRPEAHLADRPETHLDAGARTEPRAELHATLRRLVRHRLIIQDGDAFRFAGGLILEVVYDSQPKNDRADRHERAARSDSVRRSGSAAVGAHLEQAHRYRVELGAQAPDTDRLRRQAADALADAGRLALAHADPVWAAGLLTRAVHHYQPGEPHSSGARRRLGQTLIDLGRGAEGRALLEELLATAPATEADTVEAAHARLVLASVGGAGGRAESPAEAARATLPVFEAADDHLGQARACLRIAQLDQERGRHGTAERVLARALHHAVRAGVEPERAAALGAIGVSLWRGPKPVTAALDHCRTLRTEHGGGRPAVRLTLSCTLAVLRALHDDADGALADLAEAERLAPRLGYAEADVFLPLFTATVTDLAGRPEEALRHLGLAATAARDLGATGLLRGALLDAARIHLDLGDRHAARRALGDAAEGADSADLDGLRARVAAAEGDAGAAMRLARRARETAAATDSPIVQGYAALDFARAALASGHQDAAAEGAAHARRRFEAKGHLPAVRQAEAVATAVAAASAASDTGVEVSP